MSEDERDETFFLHLGAFLQLEDRTAKAALPDLLRILRAHGTAPMDAIADLLDPACVGGWKLELKRKIRGKPRQRGIPNWALLAEHHLITTRGKSSIDANFELAKRHYRRSDQKAVTAMASAVDRARRKYKAATGMSPPYDSGAMIEPRLSDDQMEAKLKAAKDEIEEYKRRRAKIESKDRARPKS
jgi:hypothetical protein